MPDQPIPSEFDSTFETITWQLAMAFGQGAGTMLATPGAVSAAIEPFRETFSNNVSQWDTWALKAIEFARALGQASAVKAVMDGAVVIGGSHVAWALDRANSSSVMPLGQCNCFEAAARSSSR